jgi:hypothetical protein
MNNKLRHFPDFAATTGLESVNDCEQARLFYSRYRDYDALHPHFDQEEPIEADDVRDLPPRETRDRPAEVQKLANGVGDLLAPVVKLINNAGGQCTATFIARNFMITAAHCMDVTSGFTPGTDPVSKAKLDRWRPYTVTWAGSNGAAKRTVVFFNVRQYVDPRYVGWSQANYVENFDSAILYVYDEDDNLLPNGDPSLGANLFPYLRTSLKISIDNSSAQAWGWGTPDSSSLYRGILSGYNLTSVIGTTALITGKFPGGSGPQMCHGDSGGPITDRYDIPDPDTGVAVPRYIEVGSFASITNPTSATCQMTTGGSVTWVRLDEEAEFFGKKVNLWYYFPCSKKKSASAGTLPDYMECWAKPCKKTEECAFDEVCAHPGSELSGCQECGSSGSCDCMYGQCLKRAPPDKDDEPQDN